MQKARKEKSFEQRAREMECEDFPELKKDSIYAPPGRSDFFFGPSWHFHTRLLTEGIVKDIRENDRMLLSVGAGPSYLERYLVKRMGVRQEMITLADCDRIMPAGFAYHIFDMHQQWPDIGRRYDYIIFPESALINHRFKTDKGRQDGLYHLIYQSLLNIKPDGQMRMNGVCQSEHNLQAVVSRLRENNPLYELCQDEGTVIVRRG